MFQRVSAVLGVATLVLAGCNDSPSGPSSVPCDEFLLSYGAVGTDTVHAATGVSYVDVAAGTGEVAATPNNVTTVNFTGYFDDGEPLQQSSCGSGVQPIGFHVGTGLITGNRGYVIEGFAYGVLGMREGGVRRVIIPAELAFGLEGENTHPLAGEDLIFDLHLVEVR